MKMLIVLALLMLPTLGRAEGRCPPGQFPVGGQGMEACAPIPSAGGTEAQPAAPRPTGKWETRWGAIAEDSSSLSLATGTSVSRKSKREASSAAMQECERQGGKKCKLVIAYHNQCVAIADPTQESRRRGAAKSMFSAEESLELARSSALQRCEAADGEPKCELVYSECSMSEFKKF